MVDSVNVKLVFMLSSFSFCLAASSSNTSHSVALKYRHWHGKSKQMCGTVSYFQTCFACFSRHIDS
jgi:hypothetical protein